jgi:phosphomannomutase
LAVFIDNFTIKKMKQVYSFLDKFKIIAGVIAVIAPTIYWGYGNFIIPKLKKDLGLETDSIKIVLKEMNSAKRYLPFLQAELNTIRVGLIVDKGTGKELYISPDGEANRVFCVDTSKNDISRYYIDVKGKSHWIYSN